MAWASVAGVPAILLTLLLYAVNSPAAADDAQRAANFIHELSDKAFMLARNDELTEEEHLQEYDTLLSQNVDIAWIGRFVLGRHVRAANADEREEYLILFRQIILHTFYAHFINHSELDLEIKGSRVGKRKKYIFVSSTLHARGRARDDVEIVWRTIASGDSFKIVDITIAGISLAITKRKEYNTLIQNNNGQIGPLLAAMRETLARLQAVK